MIMSADVKFKQGDRVTTNYARFPGIWVVRKVNPTKYLLDPEKGGRGLNAPHGMVRAAPADGSVPNLYDELLSRAPLQPGSVVTWDSPRAEGLYVVLADKVEKVNIAKLGGTTNGTYWKVSPLNLTRVDVAEILKEGVK